MSSIKSLSAAILCSTLAVAVHAGESGRLNINEASATEIDKRLVFVSEKTAQSIVEYRNHHGEFSDIHDLARVEGVSKRLARYNRSRISFE